MQRLFIIFALLSSLFTVGVAGASAPNVNTVNSAGQVTHVFCGVPLLPGQVLAENVVLPDAETCQEPATVKPVLTGMTTNQRAVFDAIGLPADQTPNTTANTSNALSMSTMQSSVVQDVYGWTMQNQTYKVGVYAALSLHMLNINSVPYFDPVPTAGQETWYGGVSIYPSNNGCLWSEIDHIKNYQNVNGANKDLYGVYWCAGGGSAWDLHDPNFWNAYAIPVAPDNEIKVIGETVQYTTLGNCFLNILYNAQTSKWDSFKSVCGTVSSVGKVVSYVSTSYLYCLNSVGGTWTDASNIQLKTASGALVAADSASFNNTNYFRSGPCTAYTASETDEPPGAYLKFQP